MFEALVLSKIELSVLKMIENGKIHHFKHLKLFKKIILHEREVEPVNVEKDTTKPL